MIINNKIIPFGKSFVAINLFGVIFTKERLSQEYLRHEYIHTAQQKELLYVGFYVWYVVEWLVRYLVCLNYNKAYFEISFEKEAYDNQKRSQYLKERKHFAWMRYL